MSRIDTSKFHKGLRILYENEPWEIIEFNHRVMQQRSPIVKTKLKNIISGYMQEKSFRSGDVFELPDLVKKDSQFLYSDSETLTFMDSTDFEQYQLSNKILGEKLYFLKQEQNVQLLHYNGSPIDIELPTAVELKVSNTEPGIKGDTVTGGNKPAELETGMKLSVPLFINTGDLIKVDTRDGKYLERVKKA
jgi:elongation factor P|tara:strand:- start:392 stop:964 length:573 start_codon:yes stop_codon:yes gene_type:complete